MKIRIFLSLFLLVFLHITKTFGQTDNEFWFAVPFITPDHNGPSVASKLQITMTDYSDTVEIQYTYNGWAPGNYKSFYVFINAHQTVAIRLDTLMYQPGNTVKTINSPNYQTKEDNSLHILSKAKHEFTAYFELCPNSSGQSTNNPDIFVLKGNNALGTDFYIPFQTYWWNQNFSNYPAYSSFDIVATQPGVTNVTITPSKTDAGGHPAGIPYTISLTQGQTYSVAPMLIHEKNGSGVFWDQPSRNPADRLAGSYVHATQAIAITTKDDSDIKSGAYDMVGDQLVPLINIQNEKVIGLEYIVMRGKVSNITSTNGEAVFITATANNTNIYLSDISGNDSLIATLNAGQQKAYTIPFSKNSLHVRGDHPIYVFHVSGFVDELGGALIPSIDGCTGSLEVSFVRSIGPTQANCPATGTNNLIINLMTKQNAIDSFFIDVGGTLQPLGGAIGAAHNWWEPVGTTGWYVLKDFYKCFNWIPTGKPVRVYNTEDVFHLGIINGVNSGGGCRYGYFSNYNEIQAKAITVETGTNLLTGCDVDTVQLQAYGGLLHRYEWSPTQYLIDNPLIPNPRAIPPQGWTDFFVKVKQPCIGYVTKRVTVFIPVSPYAYFIIGKSNGCSPLTITITNRSENAIKYRWNFGDGSPISYWSSSPTQPPFTHTYVNNTTSAITYNLYLEAESADGCVKNFSIPVTVYPEIKASFDASDSIGCQPLTINFTNTSTGHLGTYNWSFGDLSSSNDTSTSHTFTNIGSIDSIYKVEMIAISPLFCRDTARSTVRVHPYIFAHFTVDTVRGCSPMNLNIKNGSLGAIDRYEWDFGDGTPISNRSDAQFYYLYHNTGSIDSSYNIHLSVFNQANCESKIERQITVHPEISTHFTADADTGCQPLTVKFTNSSNAAANTFYWDFGDNASSYEKEPAHEFVNLTSKDTVYKVHLMATTTNLCPGYDSTDILVRAFILPKFSLDTSKICAPFNFSINNESQGGITQYNWDFGDGSAIDHSSGAKIFHQYTNTTTGNLIRNINLEVIGTGGCNKTISRPITVYPEINADFTTDKIAGCNPVTIHFADNSTAGVANHFTWEFGDGTSSNDKNTQHIFGHILPTDQVYPVKLLVTSANNCKDSITKNVTSYAYIDARFTIDKSEGCSPLLVNITDDSKTELNYSNKSWNTGDLQTYSGNLSSHTYVNTGATQVIRNLRLIVQNAHSCADTLIRPVKVNPQVTAKFTPSPSIGCNPLSVIFNNQSAGVQLRYRWEFGDSASSVIPNPPHTFENLSSTEKKFTTKLYVFSQQYECSDTFQSDITVYPFIRANFDFNKPDGCSPLSVTFHNGSSSGANGFRWLFGDGYSNNLGSAYVPHTYDYTGSIPKIFTPMLIATYNNLCPDTAKGSIQVYPKIKANFDQTALQGCHPVSIKFTNYSSNATLYKWTFGDKGTSIELNPTHTYSNFSNVDSFYTVKLEASSIYTCKDDTTKIITVYPKPKARINVLNSVDCPPFNVPIENKSEAGDVYKWTFGDGKSDTTYNLNTVYHEYYNTTSDIATYELKLLVESVHNCSEETSQNINVYPQVIAKFSPAPDTSGCSPLLVPFRNTTQLADKYEWDFGDISTSKVQNATHKFFNSSINDTTFNVRLVGISKFNCTDTIYHQVTVYPQPVVGFTALPSHLYYPDNRIKLDNETNPGYWDFLWNFDDGQSSSLRDPGTHDYAHWGEFNVNLKAWSSQCADSFSQRVRVFPPLPIADFDMSENGCVPLRVTFTDKSTWATSWTWEFDDGATSTEQYPSHIYETAGNYQVKLTVTGDGGTAYSYRDIQVYPKPEVDFVLAPNLVMLPNADVNFYNKTKYGERYLWNFGDTTQSSGTDTKHRYTNVGTYTVSLSAWSAHNCFDSIVHPNVVKVIAEGTFEFPNAFIPNPNGPSGGKYTDPDDKINEIFHPYWKSIKEFHLEIYDRWGEKLFETDDKYTGWDGYYKGKLCKADVYIWKAKAKFDDGSTKEKAGDVTLIR